MVGTEGAVLLGVRGTFAQDDLVKASEVLDIGPYCLVYWLLNPVLELVDHYKTKKDLMCYLLVLNLSPILV